MPSDVELVSKTTSEQSGPPAPWVTKVTGYFLWLEHSAYAALGAMLAVTAILSLLGAAALLWTSLGSWANDEIILQVIDRLLFVLMLIEILHTVRVSLNAGGLTCEPFLVVGLIASIRRVLVITLKSSETTTQDVLSGSADKVFRASMIELGVLALLIVVMVVSITMLHRFTRKPPRA
jgi:uncharacterized membrane protein (DUF373 family)